MRGRPKNFDRDDALELALEQFWSHGFEGTGLRDLTTCMGIGRQSLYDTFGDKRSLFLEALTVYLARELNEIRDVLEAPGSALDNVRALLADLRARILADDHCACLAINTVAERGMEDPEMEALLRRHFEAFEALVQASFERARIAGELPADADPRALARFLLNTGRGLLLLSQMGAEPEVVDDVIRVAEQALS